MRGTWQISPREKRRQAAATKMEYVLVVFAVLAAVVHGSIILQPSSELLYNQAPRLKIRASGFPVDVKSLSLEISVPFEPSLVLYTDYVLSLDPDHEGIVLSLKAGRRCVSSSCPAASTLLSALSLSVPRRRPSSPPLVAAPPCCLTPTHLHPTPPHTDGRPRRRCEARPCRCT